MSSTVAEETASPRPYPIRRVDLVVVSILAVCAGMALGAMAGSHVAGTDEPLPDRPEALAIGRIVWDEREPDESWVAEYSAAELYDSQIEHEDAMGIPGWAQVLLGDATMDNTSGVAWPEQPETLADNARRLDEAAVNLAAAGWEVSRPYDDMVQGRKGTLRVSFYHFDESTPSLEIARMPPPQHNAFMAVGALLGALAGAAAMRAFVRHRRRHHPIYFTGLGVAGLGMLFVNFLIPALLLGFSLYYEGTFEDPLWRSARFVPFGLTMNIGLLLVAANVLLLWRQRRRTSPAA